MKTNKIVYWITTSVLGLFMLFSAYAYISNPALAAGFTHLGFPSYFRIELAVAKVLGVLVLLIPAVPVRFKEWAYAGFGITFISAFIAHTFNQDPAAAAIAPVIALVILVTSYLFYRKTNPASGQ